MRIVLERTRQGLLQDSIRSILGCLFVLVLARGCATAAGLVVNIARRIDAAVRPTATLSRVARVDTVLVVSVAVVSASGTIARAVTRTSDVGRSIHDVV